MHLEEFYDYNGLTSTFIAIQNYMFHGVHLVYMTLVFLLTILALNIVAASCVTDYIQFSAFVENEVGFIATVFLT